MSEPPGLSPWSALYSLPAPSQGFKYYLYDDDSQTDIFPSPEPQLQRYTSNCPPDISTRTCKHNLECSVCQRISWSPSCSLFQLHKPKTWMLPLTLHCPPLRPIYQEILLALLVQVTALSHVDADSILLKVPASTLFALLVHSQHDRKDDPLKSKSDHVTFLLKNMHWLYSKSQWPPQALREQVLPTSLTSSPILPSSPGSRNTNFLAVPALGPTVLTVLSVWNALLPGIQDYTLISYNSIQTSLSQWSLPWLLCLTLQPTLPHPLPCSTFSSVYTTYHLLTYNIHTYVFRVSPIRMKNL